QSDIRRRLVHLGGDLGECVAGDRSAQGRITIAETASDIDDAGAGDDAVRAAAGCCKANELHDGPPSNRGSRCYDTLTPGIVTAVRGGLGFRPLVLRWKAPRR